DQRRRGGQIIVPEIVGPELPVPLQATRRRVERDERGAIQGRALPIAAAIVPRRRGDRREDQAPPHVDGGKGPDAGPRSIPPAVAFPRLGTGRPGTRDGVEGPEQLSGVCVPPSNVAVQP